MSLSRCTFSALATSSLLLVSALSATAQTVPQGSHCSVQNSDYLEMSDGRCMNLQHLPILGASQENVEAVTGDFLNALELNDYSTVERRNVVSVGDVYTSSTVTVRDNPTLAQQEANQEYLEESAVQLVEAENQHDQVARIVFEIQTRRLSEISGTMTGK